MKNIFLVSSFNDVANIFETHCQNLAGKTVTFIPTASVVEKITFYVSAGRKALEKLGLIVDELEISTAGADDIKEKLTHNDFIYVTGGNSFFLLQELKRTGADQLIASLVNAGKLYIGESAGAIVAAPNIAYIKKMDSIKKAPDLSSCDALNLVDFYPVPHCGNFPFQKAAQQIIDTYAASLNLQPFSNKDAIIVNGDQKILKSN